TNEVLQRPAHRPLLLGARQHKVGGDCEPLQTLAQDAFEQLARAITVDGVGVENSHRRAADWPRLQDRTPILQDASKRLELLPRTSKRPLLYSRDTLARHCKTEIQRGRNYDTRRAIQLLQ